MAEVTVGDGLASDVDAVMVETQLCYGGELNGNVQ